jgi:hypothetical protein
MQRVSELRLALHHVMRVEHVNELLCYHHKWPLWRHQYHDFQLTIRMILIDIEDSRTCILESTPRDPPRDRARANSGCFLQEGETSGKQYSLEGAGFKLEPGAEPGFVIRMKDRSTIRLRASSMDERRAWVIALKTAVNSTLSLTSSGSPTLSEVSTAPSPHATPPPTRIRFDNAHSRSRSSHGVRNGISAVAEASGAHSPSSDMGTDATFISASSAMAVTQLREGGGIDSRPPALTLQKSGEQIALSPLLATPEPARSPGSQPRNRYGHSGISVTFFRTDFKLWCAHLSQHNKLQSFAHL